MTLRQPGAAYSLLEVTFALAVVAIGLSGALALASRAAHSLNLAREYRATAGLIDALEAALMADSARQGLDAVAEGIPSGGPGIQYLAGFDGAHLTRAEEWPADQQPNYRLELRRLQQEPFAYHRGDGLLVLHVTVVWPVLPGVPPLATGAAAQAAGSVEFLLPVRP